MDDTVSYHFATVKQRRENRHEIDFQLTFRQQPKQSRMCGVGEKADRRPIDPPPIVQLRVVDPSLPPLEANTYLQNPYYFMYASLMAADLDEEVHLLRDGKTRSTTGSVVSSLYHLKDTNNTDAGFFVFPDLSVRMEGKYCLKLSLFEIIGKEVFHCKSILSDQFIVYSAKKFPGMEESTFLSRSFADQGLKIRIRKELRQRRKTGKRQESDDDSPHVQARLIDKRPRQYDIQHQHHHQQQQDSIVPTSISGAPTASSLSASSNSLDFRVPPPSSTQNVYSVHSSYSERPSTYFDPSVGLHWAGSSAQQQQQQQHEQQHEQEQQQQRSWSTNPTAISPGNQYYINSSIADHSRRYPPQGPYNDSFHQSNSIRQYHTSTPPSLLSTPSYSSQSPLPYPQQQQQQHQHQPSYSSYQFQPHSSRPPDPYGHQQQQQYSEAAIHQLRVDQGNSFSKQS